ncbi:MAG TPA: TetR/AcrR family transcriptional regulator [Acidimicrobiales bacterium]|nr:TetR/AcrR family transcriptional regulator [Acidimicrobiales bacterium]
MTETAATPVPEAPSAGDPRQPGGTRERILDVALDLFVEHGYDGTSLRQIAERLGITKAALYYYFASKDDILMALHMRVHEFSRVAIGALGDDPVTLETWATLLAGVMDQMMAQRPLFLMHERNQAAIEKLHHQEHAEAHDDLDTQLRRLLSDERVVLEDRVRMAGAFGVVFATLFLAGDSFLSAGDDELRAAVARVVNDVLSH